MPRFLNAALLGAALVVSTAIAPAMLLAESDSVTYHDKAHNDDHEWNGQEQKAYGAYQKQYHQKDNDFSKQSPKNQQAYWNWRHQHSDADLKIEIK
ncbi:MAG: hypothetical protein WAN65_31130 [Candidatus Sulfotelmatobacter sp.]